MSEKSEMNSLFGVPIGGGQFAPEEDEYREQQGAMLAGLSDAERARFFKGLPIKPETKKAPQTDQPTGELYIEKEDL